MYMYVDFVNANKNQWDESKAVHYCVFWQSCTRPNKQSDARVQTVHSNVLHHYDKKIDVRKNETHPFNHTNSTDTFAVNDCNNLVP